MADRSFPFAATTGCDINRSAVDFCARTFGAEPVYSSRRFDEALLPRRYALVWSGSLLTHLDLVGWRSALALMTGALTQVALGSSRGGARSRAAQR